MGLEDFLMSPFGLAALAGIIPLIIVYLIRPKPHEEIIPSLMFLMKKHGESLTSSFLRRLIYNLLLILQIFFIAFTALALAQPFALVSESSVLGHTIMVLDVSASMQAGSRLQDAIDFAISQLGEFNSIVLAKDTPEVILRDGSQTEARTIINNLKPTSTVTNLYDAIKTAESLVKEKSKIVVVSDFIDTASPSSYETAIRTLRTLGHVVNIKNVHKPANNVGIIDLSIKFPQSSVTVKNYDQTEKQVKLIIGGFSKDFSLAAGDVKTLDFDTPLGSNELKIDVQDDFKADNIAYITTPKEEKIKVLLITNEPNKYLLAALQENAEIELGIANPPTILNYNFDVIILENVDPAKLLPGTVKAMIDNVNDGKAGIIVANENLKKLDYQNLFSFREKKKEKAFSSHPVTEGIDFGSVEYIETTTGTPIVKSEKNSTVISFIDYGNGKILYYGILDEVSGFKFRIKYPIIWKEVMSFLLNRKKINEINVKTGKIITFENPTRIKTPTEDVNTDKIVLDQAGFYDFGNYRMAANLLDFKESDVNKEIAVEESLGEVIGSKGQVPLILSPQLLMLLIVLFFVELIYIKYRGDL